MSFWISNTDGKKDAVLTMTFIGFLIIALKLLMAGCTIIYNGNSFTFGSIGAAEIGAVLTPTLGAYVARRYTDKSTSKMETVDASNGEKADK